MGAVSRTVSCSPPSLLEAVRHGEVHVLCRDAVVLIHPDPSGHAVLASTMRTAVVEVRHAAEVVAPEVAVGGQRSKRSSVPTLPTARSKSVTAMPRRSGRIGDVPAPVRRQSAAA